MLKKIFFSVIALLILMPSISSTAELTSMDNLSNNELLKIIEQESKKWLPTTLVLVAFENLSKRNPSNEDLIFVIKKGCYAHGIKVKAFKLLKKNNPSVKDLSYVLQGDVIDYGISTEAFDLLAVKKNISNKDLLFVIKEGPLRNGIKKQAFELLMERNPSDDDLFFVVEEGGGHPALQATAVEILLGRNLNRNKLERLIYASKNNISPFTRGMLNLDEKIYKKYQNRP